MNQTRNSELFNRDVLKRTFFCSATILLLFLTPQGRASAQSGTGPLPGAAPSDQSSDRAPQASPGASAAQAAAKPNLAGTWKLNTDDSDNPMQKMREAQQDSGGQMGGGGGRRGGFGGGGNGPGGGGFGGGGGQNGGGDQNGSGDQNGENQQGGRRRGGMQAMAQLVIEQTPTSAKVSDGSGRVMALYLAPSEKENSSPATNASNGGANNPPAALWQDNKLVSTQQMRNGGTTTRTYEISADKKQLVVTTKIENKRFKEPVTIRQVYDPVYASTGGE